MKKTTMILTFAAAICSLTSCGNKLNTPTQMNDSHTENINSAAAVEVTQAAAEAGKASDKKDNAAYEDIAYDLVEKYYVMMPQFIYKFNTYVDNDDTVTFNLDVPNSGGMTENVTFGHISGNGLEFDSPDDIMDYRKTVYTDRYARDTMTYEFIDIGDKYNDGDYIDDADFETRSGLYYSTCIIYKGKLYMSRLHYNGGYIGHMKPNEPVIITDVTDNSFRAYYPNIYGSFGSVSSLGCDVVDFIIDPSCGDWRIDSFEQKSYSLYMEKREELSLTDTVKDTDEVSAADFTEARKRYLEVKKQLEEKQDNEELFIEDAPVKNEFTKGVSNGNIYTSEYAGFRLVAPEDSEFLDEANLYTEYMMPTRFMYEEERDHYLTAVKDASVSYHDPYGSINVWFYNIKERYPKTENMSAEDFIQREFRNDHGKGDLEEMSGPDAVNICGKEYLRIASADSSNPHSSYVRKIDDTYIVVINAVGSAVDDIESRFEAVG